MSFGFWVKAGPAYSAQCPACEQKTGVKLIETLFNGIRRYGCKLCGCTWAYKQNADEGQYADSVNKGWLPGVLTR